MMTTASKGSGFHWALLEDMNDNKPQIKTREVTVQGTSNRPSEIRLGLEAADVDGKPYLPGQPRIYLDDSSSDPNDHLAAYLKTSHMTKKTDRLLKWMKYIFVSFYSPGAQICARIPY